MSEQVSSQTIWTPSEKVVPRKIKDELIIVPIQDGVADFNDAIYSFNETGATIWHCIEQKQTLQEICSTLTEKYNTDPETIEQGVLKLVNTLLEKGIIQEWKS